MIWDFLARTPPWAAALAGLSLFGLATWFGGWLARHDRAAALVLHDPPETITSAVLQRRANDLGDPWEPKPERPPLAVRPLRPMPNRKETP